jgi:hypothetical protein
MDALMFRPATATYDSEELSPYEKLTVSHALKKSPTLYDDGSLIIMYTVARY